MPPLLPDQTETHRLACFQCLRNTGLHRRKLAALKISESIVFRLVPRHYKYKSEMSTLYIINIHKERAECVWVCSASALQHHQNVI